MRTTVFSTLVPPSREYQAGAATVSAPATSSQPGTPNAEMHAFTLAVNRPTTEVGKLNAKDYPHGGTKKQAITYKSGKVPQPKLAKKPIPGLDTKPSVPRQPTGKCFRYGRSGHRKADCHAKYILL